MNHSRLLLLMASLSIASVYANVESQKGALVLKGPKIAVEYQVISVSPNGLWACGNVNDGTGRGWRWNLTTGVIEQLSPSGIFSVAMGVADDGTVAGSFMDPEALGVHNGSETRAPGYYKDGQWHHLEVPDGYLDTTGEIGGCWHISANGRYIAGQCNMGNGQEWLPISWDLVEGTCNVSYPCTATRRGVHEGSIYDITDDGRLACGYTLDDVHYNRTPAIWIDGEMQRINTDIVGPWGTAGAFSPDGQKVLVYTGIYDIATDTYTDTNVAERFFGFEFHGIGNDGALVGDVTDVDPETMETLGQFGVYYKDGQWLDIRDYLTQQGADFTGYGVYQAHGMSADQKTFVLNTYVDNPDGVDDGYVVPMVVMLDQEIGLRPAVNVQARQLDGQQAVVLTWDAPLANASAVATYDIYRDGVRIGTTYGEASTMDGIRHERYFVDSEADFGIHSYQVLVSYSDDNGQTLTPGEMSQAISIDIQGYATAAPRALAALQSGLRQDIHAVWDAPLANAPLIRYHHEGDELNGFGGATTKFEIASRFRAEELGCYGSEARLQAVTFVPNTLEASYKLNLYSISIDDLISGNSQSMTLLHSQAIDNEELVVNQENTLLLTEPVAIPDHADVIAAIEVNPGEISSYDLVGAVFNRHISGYTDLIRIIGEKSFYSLYEAALQSAAGSYIYELTWPISLHLAPAGQQLTPDYYTVSMDGSDIAQVTERRFTTTDGLTVGQHTVGVSAHYADGSISEVTSLNVDLTATDYSQVKGVDDIDIKLHAPVSEQGDWTVDASWEVPAFTDHGLVTYSSDVCANGIIDEEDYSYQAAAKYPARLFHAYDQDYLITALRFYPTGDCDFTLSLNRDSEVLAEIALDYETGYVKNQWNVVALPEPVRVDARHSYSMVVDMYDVDKGEKPLGMDNQPAVMSYGDLYSDDYGESWKTIYGNGGANANWMMGLVLEADHSETVEVEHYQLRADSQSGYSAFEPQGTVNFSTEGAHTLQVDTYLPDGTLLAGQPVQVIVDTAHVGIEQVHTDVLGTQSYDLMGRPLSGAGSQPSLLVRDNHIYYIR